MEQVTPCKVMKGPDKPWVTPPHGWVKLSIDGSFCAKTRNAGAGVVLRDAEGTPIFTACRFLDACQHQFEAELRACVVGLELALHHYQLPIIVESDCSQLVAAAQTSERDRSPFLHWITEIRSLISHHSECVIVKAERSQVRASHFLANFARVERQNICHMVRFWV